MDYSKPTLLVISGPNGAGESTYIQSMLPKEFEGISSFNRDEIRVQFERHLVEPGISKIDRLRNATAMMESQLVEEMKNAIAKQEHFVLETPLSDPYYWTYLNLFEDAGYHVQINYYALIQSSIVKQGFSKGFQKVGMPLLLKQLREFIT